ncbi:MAG: hypothetical protein ACFB20_01325 [Opitutales bacterium]
MSSLSLALRGIAIVGAIAAGVFWYLTNGKIDDLTQRLQTTQATLDDRTATLTQTQARLTESQNTVEGLTSNLERAESELRNAERQRTDALANVRRLEGEIDQQEQTIRDLRVNVDEQKGAMVAAIRSKDDTITQNVRRITSLEEQNRNLNDEVANLQRRLNEATSLTAAAPTADAPSGGAAIPGTSAIPAVNVRRPGSTVAGASVGSIPPAGNLSEVTVLRVDPNSRAVVLQYGSSAGARQNQGLVLLEDGRLLARLELLQVQPDVSVAFVTRESPSIPREGVTYTVVR